MTIGQRICIKRKELGLSQTALAEHMGVSRQSIFKWESDAAIPEIDKLIHLSKLFSVSVGWLLGVEEDPAAAESDPQELDTDLMEEEFPETEDIPDEPFTPRERELIEALTQSQPDVPVWQRWAAMALAAVCVLSLILSCISIYRSYKYQKQLQQVSIMVSQMVSASDVLSLGIDQMENYSFSVTPWDDLKGADFLFIGQPAYHAEGITTELLILHSGKEHLRIPCQWDGANYRAEFSLEAASGYVPSLIWTTAEGIQFSARLFDPLVQNPLNGLSFRTPQVTFDRYEIEDHQLTLMDMRFKLSLPQLFRDVADPWAGCDLVLYEGETEIDRLDLLNRSKYSKQVNFSGPDVDFFTQSQTLELTDCGDGTRLTLMLECKLFNGLDYQHTIGEYTLVDNRLIG